MLAGMGAVVTFAPADGRGRVGIESARDGWYETGGAWRGGRWLNGDQTHQGRHVRLPGDTWRVQRVRLYRYT